MRSLISIFVSLALSSSIAGCTLGSDDPPPPAPPEPTPVEQTGQALNTTAYEVGAMMASMSAVSDGKSVHVMAALLTSREPGAVANDVYLRIDGEDRLTARLGGEGQQVTLTRMSAAPGEKDDRIRYEAFLPVDANASDRVIVAFLRAPGRRDAALSEVTLAPAFDVTKAPSSITKSSSVSLTVSTAAPTKIEIVGDCIRGSEGRLTLGEFPGGTDLTLKTQVLTLKSDMPTCDALLDVRRETLGTVDSAFKRAVFGAAYTVEGVQTRFITVRVSAPEG